VTTAGRSDIGIQDQAEAAQDRASNGLGDSPSRRLAQGFAALSGAILAQSDRLVLWLPVAFGLGAAAYLSVRFEPPLWPLALAFGVMAALCVWQYRRGAGMGALIGLTLASALLAGGLVAKLRTDRFSPSNLPQASSQPVWVEGYVVDVLSPGKSGGRILVAPVQIGDMAPEALPRRIRITIDDVEQAAPGIAIGVNAILNAPPPPASPGAYDFARDAYFRGIGGSGFALGPLQGLRLDPPPWRLDLILKVNAMRWALSQRLLATMGPETGAIAAAMVTGQEAWLEADQVNEMRASGLAHILSISGLHMAIVGGFSFFGLRLLIAAWPWLALRVPGKKLAAVGGLTAVGLYLILSGAPSPAIRAAITAALAFGAILVDRRAVTMHGLALAALIVLILQPEAVMEPGFQMSFAATAALIALSEAWPQQAREINTPWPLRLIQGAWSALVISSAASLTAGLATGPFAIQHFNRVATYGLLANLFSEPLTGFVIMPFLTLGAILAPFGLGDVFLLVAHIGLQALGALAAWFASQPFAMVTIASAPGQALPVAFVGLLFICLWRGPWRWLGLPFALAVSLWPRAPAPDVWIAADGANAAVRVADRALLAQLDAKRFAADLWARRRGLAVEEDAAKGFVCEKSICRAPVSAPVRLSVWQKRTVPSDDQWQALCHGAEIVVVRAKAIAPDLCVQALVLTGDDLTQTGSVEIWRHGHGWQWVQAQAIRGDRPWTH
jgi:competence protein ComEC